MAGCRLQYGIFAHLGSAEQALTHGLSFSSEMGQLMLIALDVLEGIDWWQMACVRLQHLCKTCLRAQQMTNYSPWQNRHRYSFIFCFLRKINPAVIAQRDKKDRHSFPLIKDSVCILKEFIFFPLLIPTWVKAEIRYLSCFCQNVLLLRVAVAQLLHLVVGRKGNVACTGAGIRMEYSPRIKTQVQMHSWLEGRLTRVNPTWGRLTCSEISLREVLKMKLLTRVFLLGRHCYTILSVKAVIWGFLGAQMIKNPSAVQET